MLRGPVAGLVREATGAGVLPPHLDAAVGRLEAGPWPEVAARWSRLTPSGFPVELTVGAADGCLRWTVEVAGPEVADSRRLPLAAALLAAWGQAPDPALAEELRRAQVGVELRFGAWLGGREALPGLPGLTPEESSGGVSRPKPEDYGGPYRLEPDEALSGAARLKVYAEMPSRESGGPVMRNERLPEWLPMPARVAAAWRLLPPGSRVRMLGIEPARSRTEMYARLPSIDALALLPFLHAVGHAAALTALERDLVDGLRRLRGRRLGLSVAWGPGDRIETALFASARSLFPADPAMLTRLVPEAGRPGRPREASRTGLVTLGLDPEGGPVRATVGLSPDVRARRTA
ncbi:hypothetical protein [Planotetraspora sp. GP83]|uniref:hypothetical protein n=1 Tax=Planotetraspora sp. GP83 TaxID=3156264 RepID=UPI00351165C2